MVEVRLRRMYYVLFLNRNAKIVEYIWKILKKQLLSCMKFFNDLFGPNICILINVPIIFYYKKFYFRSFLFH